MTRNLTKFDTAKEREAIADALVAMPADKCEVVLMLAKALASIDDDDMGTSGISDVVQSAWASDVASSFPELLDVVAATTTTKAR